MKTDTRHVSAAWMGHAFASDHDLALPERPRFIPELVVVPFANDGWLVVGAEHEQVLRGRSARTILPRILEACNGTRTIDDVAGSLRLPSAVVRNVVSLLRSRGLLEDGARATPIPPGVDEVARFFGRYIDVSRVNAHRSEAIARLTASTVVVTGSIPAAERLAEVLSQSGVGLVERSAERVAARGIANEALLHIVVSTGGDVRRPPPGQRAFLLRLGRDETHVGPLIMPGMTACPACLGRVHPHPAGEPDDTWAQYWVGIAAMVVPTLLARIVVSGRAGRFDTYRFSADGELIRQAKLAMPMPGCVDCGAGGNPRPHTDALLVPWIYQFSTSVPSREMVSPKAHQMHYAVANLELAQRDKKALLGGAGIPLPAPRNLTNPPPWQGSPLRLRSRVTIERVATLLARCGGYVLDANGLRRLAPTGGNLGSVDLWLIARRVAGLSPGIYFYDSPRHRLECVDEREPDSAAVAAALGNDIAADCFVVGTGALARCAQKYGPFAYRLVYLDSGVALAYAHTIAAALGLPLREAGDLDERALAGLLRLSVRWEFPIPTFAVAIGPECRPSSARTPARPVTSVGPRPQSVVSTDFSDAILPILLEASSGPPFPLATIPSRESAARPRSTASPVVLGQLDTVLRARRAVRTFGSGALDARTVVAVAREAEAVLEARVLAGAAPSRVRCMLALARQAGDLDQGLYDVRPDGLRWRSAFGQADMHAISNQSSLGAAPAALIALADLSTALEIRGARGYRESVQHAGAAIGHAWLVATSCGLVGTAAGGVLAGGLRSAADIRPYDACPLLAFHFGPRLRSTEADPGEQP